MNFHTETDSTSQTQQDQEREELGAEDTSQNQFGSTSDEEYSYESESSEGSEDSIQPAPKRRKVFVAEKSEDIVIKVGKNDLHDHWTKSQVRLRKGKTSQKQDLARRGIIVGFSKLYPRSKRTENCKDFKFLVSKSKHITPLIQAGLKQWQPSLPAQALVLRFSKWASFSKIDHALELVAVFSAEQNITEWDLLSLLGFDIKHNAKADTVTTSFHKIIDKTLYKKHDFQAKHPVFAGVAVTIQRVVDIVTASYQAHAEKRCALQGIKDPKQEALDEKNVKWMNASSFHYKSNKALECLLATIIVVDYVFDFVATNGQEALIPFVSKMFKRVSSCKQVWSILESLLRAFPTEESKRTEAGITDISKILKAPQNVEALLRGTLRKNPIDKYYKSLKEHIKKFKTRACRWKGTIEEKDLLIMRCVATTFHLLFR